MRRTGFLVSLLATALAACADPAPIPSSDPSAILARAGRGVEEIGLPAAFADALTAAGVEARALDEAGQAWAIAEVASDSGSFLIQWADLGAVAVEQVLGPETDPGAAGFYHPAAPSPFFALLDPAQVVRQSREGGALAVMNGAFFETPG